MLLFVLQSRQCRMNIMEMRKHTINAAIYLNWVIRVKGFQHILKSLSESSVWKLLPTTANDSDTFIMVEQKPKPRRQMIPTQSWSDCGFECRPKIIIPLLFMTHVFLTQPFPLLVIPLSLSNRLGQKWRPVFYGTLQWSLARYPGQEHWFP